MGQVFPPETNDLQHLKFHADINNSRIPKAMRLRASITIDDEGPTMTDIPVLDMPSALDNLDGDREIYDSVVEVFLEERDHYVIEIMEAIEEEDWESVMRGAHGLKGASMAIGGIRLSDAAAHLERKSMDGVTGTAVDLCEIIAREIESLAAAFAHEGFDA